MGNSTGSTMYMFGAVIVIYIVGMLIYQGVQWLKKNINVVCKIEKLVNMLIIIFKNEKSYTDIKSQNSNNK